MIPIKDNIYYDLEFLNDPELICLHTDKWFKVLLFNTINSSQHYSFVCTQLYGSKYSYVIAIIQLNINKIFGHS